jgi:hypothetical protein
LEENGTPVAKNIVLLAIELGMDEVDVTGFMDLACRSES